MKSRKKKQENNNKKGQRQNCQFNNYIKSCWTEHYKSLIESSM